MKKVVSIILAMTLVLSICASVQQEVQAKTFTVKKKIILIAGEKFKIEPTVEGNKFKSVKSSNKKTATAEISEEGIVTIFAKKKGKSIITFKAKDRTNYKYTVIVKKKDIPWIVNTPYNELDETTSRFRSSVLFEIENKTGIYASSAQVDFSAYGESGAVLFTGTQEVKDILPSTKIHVLASSMNLTEKVKSAKITKIEFLDREHTMDYKYLNKNDSISITETSNDEFSIKFMLKNSLKQAINGIADVVFYSDSTAKQPIGMRTIDLYTNPNGTNYVSVAPLKGFKTYKIFKRAYVPKY